ncbi:MAG TPA: oligopeptide/dipeptide ABC transporter ATP-binding protein [Polyangiaceae bacterium]|nr:oligopeptide/dipeptide ABC transporter ATP-binding protein [Polyangiaceae bacterium]
MTDPLLSVSGLKKYYPVTRGVLGRVAGQVRAVDDVSFDVGPGETLGLVGESGCGKTTVGRAILRLTPPTSGTVHFAGRDLASLPEREMRKLRKDLQIVFQDPYSSLNPRLRVADILGEALEVHGITKGEATEARVKELLRRVGLPPTWTYRYPHEFSGGQRQRIGIARAIATGPKLVVCDEAVSALDVSIQAQILNLLVDLREDLGLSYLFIAHDLSVVRHVSHRIAVMYLGQIVELAATEQLFTAPAHPYTRALLASIPRAMPGGGPRRLVLAGDVPSPLNPPSGCRFHTRCPAAVERCPRVDPAAVEVEPGHTVRCVHAEGLHGEGWARELDARIARATAAREAESSGVTARAPELPKRPAPGPRPRRERPSRRPEPRARSPKPLAIAALVLGFLLVAHAVNRVRKHLAAERALAALARELDARATITGDYPGSLSDLGYRLYPIFEGGRPVDPWGNPFRYRSPGSEGRAYDLGSTGPDGVPSRDDLGHLPVEGD